jgi:hypothetical protein
MLLLPTSVGGSGGRYRHQNLPNPSSIIPPVKLLPAGVAMRLFFVAAPR